MGENGHHCIQEHKLGIMESSIQRMEKELFNGDGGLVKNVPVLSRNVEILTQSVDDLRIAISELVTSNNKNEGGKLIKEEIKKNSFRGWQLFSIIAGSVVSLIAILSFVLTLSINKKNNEKFESVDTELSWKKDRDISPITRGGQIGTPMDTTAIKPIW